MTLQLEALTGSGTIISLFLASQLLPAVLLSPISGQLTDRFDSGRVLVISQILQAGLLTGLAHFESPTVLIAGSFLLGILFSISQPAVFTLLPSIADRTGIGLTRVNSIQEFLGRTAMLVGPAIGGVLLATLGAQTALLIDAVTFVVSVLVVLLARLSRPPQQTGETKRLFDGALAGIKEIKNNRVLSVIIPCVMVSFLSISMVNVAFVFIVRDVIGAGAGVYGMLYALWGLGMLISTVIIAQRNPKKGLEHPTFFGLTGIGLSLMLTGAIPRLFSLAAAELLGGLSNGFHNVARRTLLINVTSEAVRGRMYAAYSALANASVIGGYAIGGLFAADRPRMLYTVAGMITVVTSLLGWLVARRVLASNEVDT